MADYIARVRTNYFAVTDEQKFREVIGNCSGEDEIDIEETILADGSKKYSFGCIGYIHGLVNYEAGDEDGPGYDFELLCNTLQRLVAPGDAIIITEIAYEKLRYLVGSCIVITQQDLKCANLRDEGIALARKLLNNPAFTTQMDY